MAAAAIPLIVSGVSALLPAIPGIVQAIEGLFGAGTGAQKLPAVVNALSSVAGDMVTAGKLPAAPDATTIATLVETVVQQMIAAGKLPSTTAGTPAVAPAKPVAVPGSPTAGKWSLVGTISPL